MVVVAVPGVASLGLSEGHHFPLITDSPLEDIWIAMENQVLERFPYDENHTLVRINLEEGKERVSKNKILFYQYMKYFCINF